jgi:protein-tyrosine phosphatase
MNSVVALTAELPIRSDKYVPMLDLIAPTHEQIDAAVQAIDEMAGQRPTLVCCALGYSRSAIAVAAWLIAAGHAVSAEDAFAQ